MAVFADGYRVGAEDEFHGLGFGHLIVIEDVPFGAGAAAGFGAFEFGAEEIYAGFFGERASVRCPLNVVLVINVPVVAGGAD